MKKKGGAKHKVIQKQKIKEEEGAYGKKAANTKNEVTEKRCQG